MAGRQIPPPPSRVQEFEITWRNWLYLVFKKIYSRSFTLELPMYTSSNNNTMTAGLIGILSIVLADDTTNETQHLSFVVPDDWIEGTVIELQLRFANTQAQTGIKTVISVVNYDYLDAGDVITSADGFVSNTLSLPSGVAANTFHYTLSLSLPVSNLGIGNTVAVRLHRDAANDTCVGDVAYQTMVVTYQGFINHE